MLEDFKKELKMIRIWRKFRNLLHFALLLLIVYLSLPVVKNLVSSQQQMNTSFEPLRILNTYGAFGHITKERKEIILLGTTDERITETTIWKEYEFKCKPGDVYRRPCLISPYHYRLDWLMWFAAFQSIHQNYWMVHLVWKLLSGENQQNNGVGVLLDYDPFLDASNDDNDDGNGNVQKPPTFIKADLYNYQFSKPGSNEALQGMWWKRSYHSEYFKPLTLESKELQVYINSMGWKSKNNNHHSKTSSSFSTSTDEKGEL